MKEIYTPRDLIKQVIQVNDDVVFVHPYTRSIKVGTVVKVSAASVMIKYAVDLITSDGKTKELFCRRSADNVVRITQQVQIAKEENPEEYI